MTAPRDQYEEEPASGDLWRWAAKASRPWAGWAFIGLGSLLVLLGYLGVSRESVVEKQIPFLVSGGIGGVLLCVVGAYFLGTEELRKDSGRLDRLEAMVEELHRALLDHPDGPRPAASAGVAPTDGTSPSTLVVVPGGERFHREACPMVAGKTTETRDGEAARAEGLRACPLCDPLGSS